MLFKLDQQGRGIVQEGRGCRWEHSQNAQSDQSGIESRRSCGNSNGYAASDDC